MLSIGTKLYINMLWSHLNQSVRLVENAPFSSVLAKMLPKLFEVVVITLAIQTVYGISSHDEHPYKVSLSDSLITYYDPNTGVILEGGKNDSIAAMIYQRSLCDFEMNGLSCCVGVRFFGFNGPVCLNLFNDTGLDEIRIQLTANGRRLFSHLTSASKRLCAPLSRFSLLRVCDNIYLHYEEYHLKVCGSIGFRFLFFHSPLFYFPCIKFGDDGIHWGNFDTEQAQNQITSQSEQQMNEPEIYDEVNFEQQDLEVHDAPLSPAEEALIGQLKL
ncbi:uncharacterized protein LOC122531868 [Frieseomelitta varia]|uniref:uncharacterized protein LOC122531868 n=1 Tax=Frieseomelitta varia TaxID=561572 RepID=UPI001CB6AA34|nr:uncharacterized protein LOC122531868 [Frieseomelitta varia]